MVRVRLDKLDEMFSIIDTGALRGVHVSFYFSANTLH
jgi:hypothetical protein